MDRESTALHFHGRCSIITILEHSFTIWNRWDRFPVSDSPLKLIHRSNNSRNINSITLKNIINMNKYHFHLHFTLSASPLLPSTIPSLLRFVRHSYSREQRQGKHISDSISRRITNTWSIITQEWVHLFPSAAQSNNVSITKHWRSEIVAALLLALNRSSTIQKQLWL